MVYSSVILPVFSPIAITAITAELSPVSRAVGMMLRRTLSVSLSVEYDLPFSSNVVIVLSFALVHRVVVFSFTTSILTCISDKSTRIFHSSIKKLKVIKNAYTVG